MKSVTLISFLILGFCAQALAATTQIILVRHAEKDVGPDPGLTPEGHVRARSLVALSRIFQVSGVYSSSARRTKLTAGPSALELGIELNSGIFPTKVNLILEDILKNHRGKSVLVVGHANTVADFINAILPEAKIPEIDDTDFSRLFLLQYHETVEGRVEARLQRFTFSPAADGAIPLLTPN